MRAILAVYRLVGYLMAPLLRLWLRRRVRLGKEEPHRWREKMGYSSVQRPEGELVWLHAASVGEAGIALQLIKELGDTDPARNFLVTSVTSTSATLLAQKLPPNAIHQYAPLDTVSIARRFLRHWQPDAGVFVESEFWPILLEEATQSMPLILANGRISNRSAKRWQGYARGLSTYMLNCFDWIGVPDAEMAARLRSIGAKDVTIAGSLKTGGMAAADEKLLATLRAAAGQRKVWLAASTHEGEEAMVLSAAAKLKRQFPDLLTVLVPRHPQRANAIAALSEASGRHAIRFDAISALNGTNDADVWLIDRLGVLADFYRFSPVAFLGGSLVDRGGHNPYEPAVGDCAIIQGPFTGNFAAERVLLEDADALDTVRDASELAQAVGELLDAPENAKAQAARAKRALSQQTDGHGGLEQTSSAILTLLARKAQKQTVAAREK